MTVVILWSYSSLWVIKVVFCNLSNPIGLAYVHSFLAPCLGAPQALSLGCHGDIDQAVNFKITFRPSCGSWRRGWNREVTHSTNNLLSSVKFPVRYGRGQDGIAHLLSMGKAQLKGPHTPLEGSVLQSLTWKPISVLGNYSFEWVQDYPGMSFPTWPTETCRLIPVLLRWVKFIIKE